MVPIFLSDPVDGTWNEMAVNATVCSPAKIIITVISVSRWINEMFIVSAVLAGGLLNVAPLSRRWSSVTLTGAAVAELIRVMKVNTCPVLSVDNQRRWQRWQRWQRWRRCKCQSWWYFFFVVVYSPSLMFKMRHRWVLAASIDRIIHLQRRWLQ